MTVLSYSSYTLSSASVNRWIGERKTIKSMGERKNWLEQEHGREKIWLYQDHWRKKNLTKSRRGEKLKYRMHENELID